MWCAGPRLAGEGAMTRRPTPPIGAGAQPGGGAGAVHRFPLNRQIILTSAVTLIDASDLTHLTMRRLGAALGVEGMTLYGYVHSRADLLDGIVDLMIDDLREPPDAGSIDDWPEYLRYLAHGVRRIALTHPQVFPLVATRTAIAPWVRPPIQSLRWTEGLLDVLHRSGFSDSAVVTAYRAFTSFLLGHLLPEVAAAGVDITPAGHPGPTFTTGGYSELATYPQLGRLWPELGRDHSTVEFDEALAAVLQRLRRLRDNLDEAPTLLAKPLDPGKQ